MLSFFLSINSQLRLQFFNLLAQLSEEICRSRSLHSGSYIVSPPSSSDQDRGKGLIIITLPICTKIPQHSSEFSNMIENCSSALYHWICLSPVPVFRVQIKTILSFEVIPYKHDVRTGKIRSHLVQHLIPDKSLSYTSSVLSQPLVIYTSCTR